jgi:hypothetical protein
VLTGGVQLFALLCFAVCGLLERVRLDGDY